LAVPVEPVPLLIEDLDKLMACIAPIVFWLREVIWLFHFLFPSEMFYTETVSKDFVVATFHGTFCRFYWSPEQTQQLMNLVNSGKRQKEISKIMGIDWAVVTRKIGKMRGLGKLPRAR
jgi:hypothetical protein